MRVRTANNRRKIKQRNYREWSAVRRWIRQASGAIATALDCPDRPWFRLEKK